MKEEENELIETTEEIKEIEVNLQLMEEVTSFLYNWGIEIFASVVAITNVLLSSNKDYNDFR